MIKVTVFWFNADNSESSDSFVIESLEADPFTPELWERINREYPGKDCSFDLEDI